MNEHNDEQQPQVSPIQHKDLQKGDLTLTQYDVDRILRASGAHGCIIILTDAPMPCAEQVNGMPCTKPHRVNMFGKNLDVRKMPDFFNILTTLSRHIPPTMF